VTEPGPATRIAVNTLSNYARFAVSVGVWFVLTPAMVQGLGPSEYGLWSLVYSVVGFFSLLDLGMGTGVVKCVAEATGSGDLDRRNRMLSTYAVAYATVAAIAVVVLGVLALFFNRLFSIPEDARGRAIAVLWLVGLRAVVLAFPLSLFRGVLFGGQRLLLLNSLQAASLLAYGFGAMAALARGGGIVALAVIGLVAMLAEHALYALFAARGTLGLALSLRLVEPSLLREAMSLSVSQVLIAASGLILLRTDPIVIQLVLGLSAVGVYAVALKVAENGFVLVKQFVNALAPLVAQLHGAGRAGALREVLLTGTRLACVPAVLLAVGAFALGGRALELWVGPEMRAAAPVLTVLMVSMALTVPQMVVFSLLTYTDRHRLPAQASVLAALINLGVTLALVKPLGLVGVAFGTLLATLVVDVAWVLRRGCRELGVPGGVYLREGLRPLLLPGFAQWALTAGLVAMRAPASLGAVLLYGAPGVLAFAAVFWRTGLRPAQRETILNRLRRLGGRPGAPAASVETTA